MYSAKPSNVIYTWYSCQNKKYSSFVYGIKPAFSNLSHTPNTISFCSLIAVGGVYNVKTSVNVPDESIHLRFRVCVIRVCTGCSTGEAASAFKGSTVIRTTFFALFAIIILADQVCFIAMPKFHRNFLGGRGGGGTFQSLDTNEL